MKTQRKYDYGTLKLYHAMTGGVSSYVSAESEEEAKSVLISTYFDGYTQEEIESEIQSVTLVEPMRKIAIANPEPGETGDRYAFQWAVSELHPAVIISSEY